MIGSVTVKTSCKWSIGKGRTRQGAAACTEDPVPGVLHEQVTGSQCCSLGIKVDSMSFPLLPQGVRTTYTFSPPPVPDPRTQALSPEINSPRVPETQAGKSLTAPPFSLPLAPSPSCLFKLQCDFSFISKLLKPQWRIEVGYHPMVVIRVTGHETDTALTCPSAEGLALAPPHSQ